MSDAGGRIDHVMLPVTDLEQSISFYADLFGMIVVRRREARDGKPRAAHIGFRGQGLTTIELIEASDRSTAKSVAGHICIHMPDLGAFRETLIARAASEILHPDAPQGERIWIRDPDGHLLEIVTRRD